ncbi:MAG TPA: hypothetical protein VGM53_35395 [Streptosporangiaceae bacterium]|jgi:hypothetical protein
MSQDPGPLMDMAGKAVRQPGRPGGRGRRTRQERAAASRAARDAYWGSRIAATTSPVEALGVLADRAAAVAVQAERRAAVALQRARSGGNPAEITAAERRLETTRRDLAAGLEPLLDSLAAYADRYETTRA